MTVKDTKTFRFCPTYSYLKDGAFTAVETKAKFLNKYVKGVQFLEGREGVPFLLKTQGPEEMCLSLEHQNPSKTSEKMGYFDPVTVSLHIL